jgi:hypothetical protein
MGRILPPESRYRGQMACGIGFLCIRICFVFSETADEVLEKEKLSEEEVMENDQQHVLQIFSDYV